MYSDWPGLLLLVVGVACLVWLVGLSFVGWKNYLFLQKLFPARAGNLKEKLEAAIKEIQGLEDFKKQSLEHIQKVALKRYNPYQDTGGDQSFSVVFLNGLGDGVVVTSLHSRASTRVFAKPIKKGKEGGVSLSEEEKEVVNWALSGKQD